MSDQGVSEQTLQPGMRLVVASHNPGKVWEIKQLIVPFGLDAVSAGDLNLAEPEETETTFAGNARLKAVAAADASGLPALADDSGLEVAALGGAPGIYSARWAGPSKDFSVAMEKVASELSERHGWAAPGPVANFTCALCLAWPDGGHQIFEGKVFGRLVWPPRGGNGFGYDPMFIAEGEDLTFGEMEPEKKYANSHRTRAFAMFKAACLEGLPIIAGKAGVGAGRDHEALSAAAANLSTRLELAAFIGQLSCDLELHGAEWENADLPRFLQALQVRIAESESLDEEPRWRMIAKALLHAASGHE